MNNPTYSRSYLLLAACIGAAVSYGTLKLATDDIRPSEQIIALENRIQNLELLLAKKEAELTQAGVSAPDLASQNNLTKGTSSAITHQQPEPIDARVGSATTEPNIEQIRKDLSTRFIGDPRTFSEKLSDFVAENPGQQTIAIASKTLADMAENQDTLPNDALEFLYQKQTNPDLKRIAAQVLSMRGDNSLMEKQVTDAQSALKSENPAERQKALLELAKTRYAGAANAIAPLVQDGNTSVKLDALLALRATGNESHIRYVENLVNHPDPSVSWLANDVIGTIQNLSEKARTKLVISDIVAELPPIPMTGN